MSGASPLLPLPSDGSCVCEFDFGSLESPLLWVRGDPELEYLAELNLVQPEQMWVCILYRR